MGDINSAFLPKLRAVRTTADSSSTSPATTGNANSASTTASGTELTDAETVAAIHAQAEDMDHQIVDKPLAKLQEEKSAMLHERAAKSATGASPSPVSSGQSSTSDQVGETEAAEAKAEPGVKPPAASAASQSAATATAAVSRSNGIGASRFVTKMQTDDASDSESEADSSDAEEPATTESEAVMDARSTTPDEGPLVARDIPVAGVAKDEHTAESPSSAADESQAISMGAPSSQIDAKEEAVLHDDDRELERVLSVLSKVHESYYGSADGTRNVEEIIPRMKEKVLAGCNIVFSGVIPLDQDTTRYGKAPQERSL